MNDVVDFENLYVAYKKARGGKGHKSSKLKFEMTAMQCVEDIIPITKQSKK